MKFEVWSFHYFSTDGLNLIDHLRYIVCDACKKTLNSICTLFWLVPLVSISCADCQFLFELWISDIVEDEKKAEFKSFLKVLPPVEFACVYGSSLHPNNQDKVSFWLTSRSLLHYYQILFFFFRFKVFVLSFYFWISSQPWQTIFLVYQIPSSGIPR